MVAVGARMQVVSVLVMEVMIVAGAVLEVGVVGMVKGGVTRVVVVMVGMSVTSEVVVSVVAKPRTPRPSGSMSAWAVWAITGTERVEALMPSGRIEEAVEGETADEEADDEGKDEGVGHDGKEVEGQTGM